jgi:hypothetical protein
MLGRLAVALLLPTAVVRAQEEPALRLQDVLEAVDAETFETRSLQGLLRSGENALPVLLQAFDAAASGDADENAATRRRARILRCLRVLGARAAPATAELIEQLRSAKPDEAPLLLQTLAEIAPFEEEPSRHLDAALAASKPFLTPGDKGFIDRLRGSIRLYVRLRTALPDIESCVEGLTDDDPFIREFGAERLGRMGTGATDALAALERTRTERGHPRQARLPNHSLSSDFDEMIQDAAAIAIARIAPHDPRSIPGFVALLESPDPREQVEAVMAIGRARAAAGEQALRRLLKGNDPRLRAEAVTALGMLESPVPATLHDLRNLATGDDPALAARARAALRNAGIEIPTPAQKGTDTKR